MQDRIRTEPGKTGRRHRHHRATGFTLVEVLVTVAIIVVLAALVVLVSGKAMIGAEIRKDLLHALNTFYPEYVGARVVEERFDVRLETEVRIVGEAS